MNMYEEIDEILDNFDFEKVKKVMDALEWKYWDSQDSHVTIPELRKKARELLKTVYCKSTFSDHWCAGTGGFEAERWMYPGDTKKYLYLKFIVEEQTNAH